MKNLRHLMLYVLLFGQVCPPGLALADEAPQGQATTEVENWKSEISANNQRIRAVQDQILGLKTVFRAETIHLRAARAKYREDPVANRRYLQGETAASLTEIANQTADVLAQREIVLLGAVEIERKAQERAASYRAEGEQLDRTLPDRQTRLAMLQAENDKLKDAFAQSPSDRDMERKLRAAYREETRQRRDIEFDLRRTRLLTAAATKLDGAAGKVARLYDGLEGAFDSVEAVHADCRKNAALLVELMEMEETIDAFTGGGDMGSLLAEVGAITNMTNELSGAIADTMDALMESNPDDALGGPLPSVDSGFDRWLNDRQR